MVVLKGDPATHLVSLAAASGAKNLYWNRCYEPWRIARDTVIKTGLVERGLNVDSHNGSLLWEPWDVTKADGTPYRVFTPIFVEVVWVHRRHVYHCLCQPISTSYRFIDQDGIDGLHLRSDIGWDAALEPHWQIGEAGAKQRLTTFIDRELSGYKDGRNFPACPHVSRLSPYLHWGEVSPHTVWYAAKDRIEAGMVTDEDGDHFLSELGWREFSYSLLYYFPDLPRRNLQRRFDHFPGNRTKPH